MVEIFSKVTGLTALIFISALITFNAIGFLQPVNPLINNAFPEEPNISCTNDSDCVLAIPTELSQCRICDPYGCRNYLDSMPDVIAISKGWQPRCIFWNPPGACVSKCKGGIQQGSYEPKCMNASCAKSKKP